MHQLHAFTISFLYPVTPRKMSTTMSVLDNTALIEGRGANGEQFYDKYTDAPLKVRPGQWNSVTFTVEQPTAELPHGRVRLCEWCLISNKSQIW